MQVVLNILGQRYKVIKENDGRCEKLDADGLCEFYTKEIWKEEENTLLNAKEYKSKVLRHEIIHAFLHESGLDSNSTNGWARNEEMVDFFAIQIPKMIKAMKVGGCI